MSRSHVTTHVLDSVAGRPAAGLLATLETADGVVLASARTDADGRVGSLGPETLPPGSYRVRFATGEWFATRNTPTFYPEVSIDFAVTTADEHYHVPLLLSPFAYSTYRGS